MTSDRKMLPGWYEVVASYGKKAMLIASNDDLRVVDPPDGVARTCEAWLVRLKRAVRDFVRDTDIDFSRKPRHFATMIEAAVTLRNEFTMLKSHTREDGRAVVWWDSGLACFADDSETALRLAFEQAGIKGVKRNDPRAIAPMVFNISDEEWKRRG